MSLDAKSIGARIRALRLRKGETQVEFGKAVGSLPFTVGNWEKGRTVPKLPKLKAISTHCGVDIEYLTGGTTRVAQAVEQGLKWSSEIFSSENPTPQQMNFAKAMVKDAGTALTQTVDTATNETRQMMEGARERFRSKLARLRLGQG